MVTRQKLTVEEYLALPEEKPYLEYVCGEAIAKPMPDRNHSRLAHKLSMFLGLYEATGGGETFVEGRSEFVDLDDPRYLLPDVSYYAPGRDAGDRLMTPPSLAIEIRSEGQTLRSLRDKCRYYRAHGVDAAWLIDPTTRTAEIFDVSNDGTVIGEDGALSGAAVPGFAVTLRELFAVLR